MREAQLTELLDELGQQVANLCPEAYFVGGCVRDLLRGDPIKDVDFALSGDTHAVARTLARNYEGHVFWLRQEEGVVRVLLPQFANLQLDFSPLRGTLEQDLLARDLTINAMAVAAGDGLHPGTRVIDLCGGLEDLRSGTIRFVTPQAPVDDPLRTLRAFRFRWKFNFALPDDTLARIRECIPLLERVSSERIRDELFQLLSLADPSPALRECLEVGMAPWLMGRSVRKATDDVAASCPTSVARLIVTLQEVPAAIRELLQTIVSPPRTRRELLIWSAALLPVVPPVDPNAAARHLALSNDERQLITKSLGALPEVRRIAAAFPVPGRERFRLFQKAGVAGPETVLLAASVDGWTAAHAELLAEALQRHRHPLPPLLSGTDIMAALNTGPGPNIGRLIQEIEERRADGLLQNREEALQWLQDYQALDRQPNCGSQQ